MKKKTDILIILAICLMIAGCGKKDNKTDNIIPQNDQAGNAKISEADTSEIATTEEYAQTETGAVDTLAQGSSSNTLVVYFSRTGEQYTVGVIEKGNTAIVAEMIAQQTGADLLEVLPADDHYPMTYAELTDVAKQEQNDNARPAYAKDVPDLSQYTTIFIGAPVWWGDWPMIMYTFFEQNAEGLFGKRLVPFSIHEGSGLSGFDRKLKTACLDSIILDGLAIRGNDCQNDQDSVRNKVSDWILELKQ